MKVHITRIQAALLSSLLATALPLTANDDTDTPSSPSSSSSSLKASANINRNGGDDIISSLDKNDGNGKNVLAGTPGGHGSEKFSLSPDSASSLTLEDAEGETDTAAYDNDDDARKTVAASEQFQEEQLSSSTSLPSSSHVPQHQGGDNDSSDASRVINDSQKDINSNSGLDSDVNNVKKKVDPAVAAEALHDDSLETIPPLPLPDHLLDSESQYDSDNDGKNDTAKKQAQQNHNSPENTDIVVSDNEKDNVLTGTTRTDTAVEVDTNDDATPTDDQILHTDSAVKNAADSKKVNDSQNTNALKGGKAKDETDKETQREKGNDDQLSSSNSQTDNSLKTKEGVKGNESNQEEDSSSKITSQQQQKEKADDQHQKEHDEHQRKFMMVDYANKSTGALILDKSSNFKGTSNLLINDQDRYAISPCDIDTGSSNGKDSSSSDEKHHKFVIIGLSEDILIKTIKIANYERYSSQTKQFQILGSQTYPMGEWADLGTYTAKPSFKGGEQAFDLLEPGWARYLKFTFLSHYGAEHYCTVSQIKVHGSTTLQGYHEMELDRKHLDDENDEDDDEGEDEKEENINSSTNDETEEMDHQHIQEQQQQHAAVNEPENMAHDNRIPIRQDYDKDDDNKEEAQVNGKVGAAEIKTQEGEEESQQIENPKSDHNNKSNRNNSDVVDENKNGESKRSVNHKEEVIVHTEDKNDTDNSVEGKNGENISSDSVGDRKTETTEKVNGKDASKHAKENNPAAAESVEGGGQDMVDNVEKETAPYSNDTDSGKMVLTKESDLQAEHSNSPDNASEGKNEGLASDSVKENSRISETTSPTSAIPTKQSEESKINSGSQTKSKTAGNESSNKVSGDGNINEKKEPTKLRDSSSSPEDENILDEKTKKSQILTGNVNNEDDRGYDNSSIDVDRQSGNGVENGGTAKDTQAQGPSLSDVNLDGSALTAASVKTTASRMVNSSIQREEIKVDTIKTKLSSIVASSSKPSSLYSNTVTDAVKEIGKMIKTKISPSTLGVGSGVGVKIKDGDLDPLSLDSKGGENPEDLIDNGTKGKVAVSSDGVGKVRVEEQKTVKNANTIVVEGSTTTGPSSPVPSGEIPKALDDMEKLTELTQKFSSASCLEGLNFNEFKTKVLASKKAGTKTSISGTGSGGIPGGPKNLNEPIYMKLTEEIRTLQMSHGIYDQYMKTVTNCYQVVITDMMKQITSIEKNQEERMSSMEERLEELANMQTSISFSEYANTTLQTVRAELLSLVPYYRSWLSEIYEYTDFAYKNALHLCLLILNNERVKSFIQWIQLHWTEMISFLSGSLFCFILFSITKLFQRWKGDNYEDVSTKSGSKILNSSITAKREIKETTKRKKKKKGKKIVSEKDNPPKLADEISFTDSVRSEISR